MGARRTIRVDGLPSYPYFDDCAYENPPCPKCHMDAPCGGVMYKFFKYTFNEMFNVNTIFIPESKVVNEYGRLSMDGEADIMIPHSTYTTRRHSMLKPDSPIFFTKYVAFIKEPGDEDARLSFDQFTVCFAVGLIVAFTLQSIVEHISRRIFGRVPHEKQIWKIARTVLHITYGVFLAYLGSSVTIAFYIRSGKKLPFETFSELSTGLVQRKYIAITPFQVNVDQLFKLNGSDSDENKLFQQLHMAYKINPPKILDIPNAMKLVLSSPRYVLILSSEIMKIQVRQSYCGFIEIADKGELPTAMHGFYFRRNFTFHVDWYQRSVIREEVLLWAKRYLHNATNDCKARMPVHSKYNPLDLMRLLYVFLFLLCSLLAGVVLAVFERIYAWLRTGQLINADLWSLMEGNFV